MPLPPVFIPGPDNETPFLGRASRSVAGEIYTDGRSLFVVDIAPVSDGSRAIRQQWSSVTANDDVSEQHSGFEIIVSAITRGSDRTQVEAFIADVERAFELKLTNFPYESGRFSELVREDGRSPPPPPSERQTNGARALVDRTLRSLAISIRTAGGILTRDLQKTVASEAREFADQLRDKLEQHGLASSEFVVVCRKSQASIATIPSRDALISLSDIGMKCSCGRLIADEDVQEALAVTDLGRWLLDGSKWLTLLLLEELQNVGVSLEEILIEQQFGGDEIDCLAVISGELVLFELKDKDFNLGNAYPFGAKVSFIQPEHSVILTTQRVGNDAREHFHRAKVGQQAKKPWEFDAGNTNNLRYIEGIDHLAGKVQELASSIYLKDAEIILEKVLSHATLKSRQIMVCLGATSGLTDEQTQPIMTTTPLSKQDGFILF